MTPTVSRLLRWAAVIGVGVALTLAAWQDPVLAYGPGRSGTGASGLGPVTSVGMLGGFLLALSGRHRPLRVTRRPVPSRPVSVSRPPGRRRSHR
ncbi:MULTISPECIES: hypothetical protein [Micromonospora]|uniref:Uncharacterized protein n=1 Tax=Micromonospora solifontis TaxID=2487138 RepID=A0ABX9WBB5_9ACTN|nr:MULTISPECIES: hypothetical protein [Micromonospora]NES13399.1 hypothetical protein [Micromonospora sp. PPF5-17B]NES39378.1 hypothetical protein [Micromonospora solifontis]NES55585.1 hypothetical protein [Micromonospora sp. PPF5-6]RNL89183.1 hypothetical protein EFE23_25145 [Micromonospora solifontis]